MNSCPLLNSTRKSGFTLIELILIVALLTILASAAAPFYTLFISENNLEIAENKLVSTIRKSQSYAMDGKDGSVWGFCMSGNSLRLFKGSCAVPSFFEEFDLSDVNVTGVNEVTFSGISGRRGEPSQPLNITLSNDAGSVGVVLNSLGGLDVTDL